MESLARAVEQVMGGKRAWDGCSGVFITLSECHVYDGRGNVTAESRKFRYRTIMLHALALMKPGYAFI